MHFYRFFLNGTCEKNFHESVSSWSITPELLYFELCNKFAVPLEEKASVVV
jgi:hypothetical protein